MLTSCDDAADDAWASQQCLAALCRLGLASTEAVNFLFGGMMSYMLRSTQVADEQTESVGKTSVGNHSNTKLAKDATSLEK